MSTPLVMRFSRAISTRQRVGSEAVIRTEEIQAIFREANDKKVCTIVLRGHDNGHNIDVDQGYEETVKQWIENLSALHQERL